jgi:hypothetical protein
MATVYLCQENGCGMQMSLHCEVKGCVWVDCKTHGRTRVPKPEKP